MTFHHEILRRPRVIGVICGAAAVMLGIAYMMMAGAPRTYIGINVGAFGIGLMALVAIRQVGSAKGSWSSAMVVAMAALLLLTALVGDRIDGAARWVRFGPLVAQPSLILLPLMVLAFARARDAVSAAGMIIAAAALALQPDRGMAGVLAAGLACLALVRPDRFTLTASLAGVAAFLVTLFRTDALPAVPYVDQILYSAFDVHFLAGMAVLGGSFLLLVPAIAGWHSDAENRAAYLTFGAVWFAATLAAALGNYPTPIVGFGGSAIIGYLLSLQMLPMARGASSRMDAASFESEDGDPDGRSLTVGLA